MGDDSNKYRDLYIEEKFTNVHDRIDNVEEGIKAIASDVKQILIQTKKTNGRVTHLEMINAGCPISSVKSDVDQIKKDTSPLPDILKDVEEIKKETEVTRFLGKHPQIAKLAGIGLFVLLTANIVLTLIKFI